MNVPQAIRTHKKSAFAAVGAALLLLAVVVFTTAKHVSPAGWGWYGEVDAHDGLALRGFDAVALHDGLVVPGSEGFAWTYRGARWRFQDAGALEQFRAAPESYAPAFGGFCSFAMSRGFTATADPHAHYVDNDQLFVFDSSDFRDQWVRELPGSLERSRQHWAERN